MTVLENASHEAHTQVIISPFPAQVGRGILPKGLHSLGGWPRIGVLSKGERRWTLRVLVQEPRREKTHVGVLVGDCTASLVVERGGKSEITGEGFAVVSLLLVVVVRMEILRGH